MTELHHPTLPAYVDNLCLDGNQGQVLWFCSVERWSPGQVEVDIYVLCTIFED
jgi:hypothetical protein